MKDIKKAGAGAQRRAVDPNGVSQAALLETEGCGKAQASPVGSAGTVGGRAAVYARVSSEQQEKEETVESQMAAIAALGEIGGTEAKTLLLSLARDAAPAAQEAVRDALSEIDAGETMLSFWPRL